jgi:hypothetical protein
MIETAAPDEILEPRIGSQRIEAQSQQNTRIKSFFLAFLDPVHRLSLIVQGRVDYGNLGCM